MTEEPIDYSRCTVDELEDVERNIDPQRFPERLEEVRRQLARRRATSPGAVPLAQSCALRLSIKRLITQSWVLFVTNWRLLTALSVVAVPLGALTAYLGGVLHSYIRPDSRLVAWIVHLSVYVLCSAAITVVALPWHRLALIPEESAERRPRWDRHHLRFWKWCATLAVLSTAGQVLLRIVVALVVAVLAQMNLGNIASLVTSTAAALIAITAFWCIGARISLVLPAAAIGVPTSLSNAWSQSMGNGLRLGAALFLVIAPICAVFATPELLLDNAGLSEDPASPRSPIRYLWWWLAIPALTALEAGVLAAAYQELSAERAS